MRWGYTLGDIISALGDISTAVKYLQLFWQPPPIPLHTRYTECQCRPNKLRNVLQARLAKQRQWQYFWYKFWNFLPSLDTENVIVYVIFSLSMMVNIAFR